MNKKIMAKEDILHLEPRVVKLETGLDILTKNVNELTSAVRDQSISLDTKLERLTVAVTQAQAPKAMDWSMIISAIFLILAIGSAVFWPLNQTAQNNKTDTEKLEQDFKTHQSLKLHPVGEARIDAMEQSILIHNKDMETRDTALDVKLQREMTLALAVGDAKLTELDIRIQREFNLLNDRTSARLTKIEEDLKHERNADNEELRQWRNKASGLNSPGMSIPLISKDITSK